MKNRNKNIRITKASGELLPFSEKKLIQSLLRADASESMAEKILEELRPRLYEGVTTKKIYKWAFNLLRGKSKPLAAKYHLKRGIMELGPSGYPFEKFIGEILKFQGYEVQTSQVVKGKCVNHEIDVIAGKEDHHFMIECKYHNQPGTVCDVKIPLYIQARFKDVESEWLKILGHGKKFHQGWVVTNTRFTVDAIKYGICAGLNLVGWNFPDEGSLRNQIDKSGLYPVTCLTSLTKHEKAKLLEQNIVLCREICYDEKILQGLEIPSSRIKIILEEGRQLCRNINKTEQA